MTIFNHLFSLEGGKCKAHVDDKYNLTMHVTKKSDSPTETSAALCSSKEKAFSFLEAAWPPVHQ